MKLTPKNIKHAIWMYEMFVQGWEYWDSLINITIKNLAINKRNKRVTADLIFSSPDKQERYYDLEYSFKALGLA